MITQLHLLVDATGPQRARQDLARWLAPLGGNADTVDDLVYATSEAVMNRIDHAFLHILDGAVTLHPVTLHTVARSAGKDVFRVEVTVTDTGRWRPPPTDPGTRGRGLLLMKHLVDQLDVSSSESGTRVLMISHLTYRAAVPPTGPPRCRTARPAAV